MGDIGGPRSKPLIRAYSLGRFISLMYNILFLSKQHTYLDKTLGYSPGYNPFSVFCFNDNILANEIGTKSFDGHVHQILSHLTAKQLVRI